MFDYDTSVPGAGPIFTVQKKKGHVPTLSTPAPKTSEFIGSLVLHGTDD